MDPGLLSILFCALIAAVVLTPRLLARLRAEQERGRTPVFEAFCSGRRGLIGANIPMFRLSIYDGFLVIAFLSPTVIPFAQVTRANVFGGRLLSGVRIETRGGATYRLAIKNPERVVGLLRHA